MRYASHEGIAVLVTKSNKLLQSVTIVALWRSAKALGGLRQSNCGITREPHKSRIQLSLPTPRDIEKASADNVDPTTLAIFFDDQVKGLIGASWFFCSSGVVAKTIIPWKDASCLGLANEASPKTTCDTCWVGMDRKKILTSLVSSASRSNLLANRRVLTLGCAIEFALHPAWKPDQVWYELRHTACFQLEPWKRIVHFHKHLVQECFFCASQFRWGQFHECSPVETQQYWSQEAVLAECLWM